MAAAFSPFRAPIVASAEPPNPRGRKIPQQNSWWQPIFGWSSEPDYVSGNAQIEADPGFREGSGRVGAEKKQYRGCLTEEKARELRRKTVESSNFHDVMYHSAIASRLASDLSGR